MESELITLINNRFNNNSCFDVKTLFLVKMALSASIASSIHRSIYLPDVSASNKKLFRVKWNSLLLEYSKIRFEDINDYSDIVFGLTEDLIDAAKGVATITLAHAQKSLSLFLKYLWCYRLIDTPVACPIDRIILSIAKNKDNDPDCKIKIKCWTELDLKEKNQYLYILRALDNWSGNGSIAEKELRYWNNATNL